MNKYEMTYLTLQEENLNASTVSGTLAEHEAKIVAVHPWGARRKLVYPIKKQDQAFYTTVVFEVEPAKLQSIERALLLNATVLRSLIVHYTPGFFDRETRQSDESSRSEARKEAPKAGSVETGNEVATPATTPETPTEEAKPKRTRAAKKEVTAEEQKALDDKLAELLSEDITK